jgi:serine/threonine-protein kinase
VLFLVAAVGAALLVSNEQRRSSDKALQAARDHASRATREAVQDTLRRRAKTLADEVAILAENEQLRLGIATDAQTVQNQIAEEGLRSLRNHDVFAIGRADPQNPSHIELLIARGFDQIAADAINASHAVSEAMAAPTAPPASGYIPLPVGIAVVAAAPVTSHDQVFKGYLLIGERLTRRTLEPLATETRSLLLLSDGTHALGYAGNPELEAALSGAVGHEAQFKDTTFTDDAGTLAAHAIDLTPTVSLWVGASVANEAETLQQAVHLNIILTWVISVVVGGALAVAFFLRGRARPAIPPLPAPGATLPAPGVTIAPTPPPAQVPGTAPGPLPINPGGTRPGATVSPTGATPPVAGASPAAGTPPVSDSIFGRYQLLDRLGSGGMAEVWTAVVYGAEGFRRPFVVKRIRRDMTGNADLVQQFIDEANLASQLVHSNVVPVFDFGNLNGEYFLAQEYILGRDLGKLTAVLAQRGRRLDPAIAAYILSETLKALDYAHTLTDKTGRPLGIVHRDISPNNILCSMRGEVKLIDFGIAKSVSKVGQTEAGTVKGNLRFMSPEQAQGQPVDHRSDIFSLGMSLYFTQTGESLYTASGPYDLLLMAAKGPQPADLEKILALAPPLNELLRYALAPAVAQRYPSAQVFLETALPKTPADGARRLSALIMDLFGDELRKQEQRFSEAIAQAGTGDSDATIQRLSPAIRQGLS